VGLGHSLVKRERLQRVGVGRRRRIDEVELHGLLASRVEVHEDLRHLRHRSSHLPAHLG